MQALYRCIAGMDVHRMLYVLTVLIELPDGSEEKHQRSFGGFKRERRAKVFWLVELGADLVVMESPGIIYWKSIYSTLEKAGIPAPVVNARHVKNVPGRKPAPDPIRGPTCPIPNGWPGWGATAWSNRQIRSREFEQPQAGPQGEIPGRIS